MSYHFNYSQELESDTQGFADEHFKNYLEYVEQGNVGIYDYRFFYLYERIREHFDTLDFDLHEAVEVLENCDNEETDSGMWEGQSPKDAIKSMAYYSYLNDLHSSIKQEFSDRLEKHLEAQRERLDNLVDALDEDKEKLEALQETVEFDESDGETYDEAEANIKKRIEICEEQIADLENFIDYMEEAQGKL